MIACTFSKHAMFILSGLLLTSTELNDIQSTFVILKSKGLSNILQDIRASTYQICRTEEKINRTTPFHK